MEFLGADDFAGAQSEFLSMVGHTHLPLALGLSEDGAIIDICPDNGQCLIFEEFPKVKKWALNPGTIGLRQGDRSSDQRSGWRNSLSRRFTHLESDQESL